MRPNGAFERDERYLYHALSGFAYFPECPLIQSAGRSEWGVRVTAPGPLGAVQGPYGLPEKGALRSADVAGFAYAVVNSSIEPATRSTSVRPPWPGSRTFRVRTRCNLLTLDAPLH